MSQVAPYEDDNVVDPEVQEDEELIQEDEQTEEDGIDWKARALKAEQTITRAKQKQREQKPLSTQKSEPVPAFDAIADNIALLRNLDDEELGELRTEAKALGVSPESYAKSKAWSAQLSALRQEKQSRQVTVSSGDRPVLYEGKTWDDIVTDTNASAAQKQAAFDALRQARQTRRSSM